MGNPVLLFDGLCNLCSGSVQFVLKHEKNDDLKFASLQSAYGQQTITQLGLPPAYLQSLVLVENGKYYTKSTAALKLAKYLKGLWPTLYVLILFPPFIRNWVYDLVAKNRYKWWGKKETCWLPLPKWKARFIDSLEVHDE